MSNGQIRKCFKKEAIMEGTERRRPMVTAALLCVFSKLQCCSRTLAHGTLGAVQYNTRLMTWVAAGSSTPDATNDRVEPDKIFEKENRDWRGHGHGPRSPHRSDGPRTTASRRDFFRWMDAKGPCPGRAGATCVSLRALFRFNFVQALGYLVSTS